MAIRTVLIIVLVLLSCTMGLTAQATELSVETENGKKFIIKYVRSGYIKTFSEGNRVKTGVDSQGNPIYRYEGAKRKLIETNDIPLKVGDGFGFGIRLPDIPENDVIVITAVTKLPNAVNKGKLKSDTVKGKFRYDHIFSGKVEMLWWSFRKEHPQYHMTGTWTLLLYNKGKLLISRSFNIKR